MTSYQFWCRYGYSLHGEQGLPIDQYDAHVQRWRKWKWLEDRRVK